MNIKIFIPQIFVFMLFDLSLKAVSQLVLSLSVEAEKIDAEDLLVTVHQPINMPLICLFVLFFIRVYWDGLLDSCLFPEKWNRPSDLHMTETLILSQQNLFSLAIVSNIPLDINSSGIESSASSGPTTTSDQHILENMTWIIKNIPSTAILKLLTEPWTTPLNQRWSSNL